MTVFNVNSGENESSNQYSNSNQGNYDRNIITKIDRIHINVSASTAKW